MDEGGLHNPNLFFFFALLVRIPYIINIVLLLLLFFIFCLLAFCLSVPFSTWAVLTRAFNTHTHTKPMGAIFFLLFLSGLSVYNCVCSFKLSTRERGEKKKKGNTKKFTLWNITLPICRHVLFFFLSSPPPTWHVSSKLCWYLFSFFFFTNCDPSPSFEITEKMRGAPFF